MNQLQSAARADLDRLPSPTPVTELERRAGRRRRRVRISRVVAVAVVIGLAAGVPSATLSGTSTTRLRITSRPSASYETSTSSPGGVTTTTLNDGVLPGLPALGAPGFPESVYPAAVRSATPALPACPNPVGLEPFNPQTQAAALGVLSGLNTLTADLQATDRSLWTTVVAHPLSSGTPLLISVGAASQSPYAAMIALACGSNLVQNSLAVVVGPQGSETPGNGFYGCVACRGNFFFVNRAGHPLIYFAYP